jgi:peptide deformylase
MSVLSIKTYPDPILKKKAGEILDPKSPEIKELISSMLETMDAAGNALGLAAPQVGKSLRLCIIILDEKTHILINPKITSKSTKQIISEEGCLSFPGEFLQIKRSHSVIVKTMDENGKNKVIRANGLFARALQHEIDHLDGVLFTKRAVKEKVAAKKVIKK